MIWLLLLAFAQESPEPSVPKALVRGSVVDRATGAPVAEALVTVRHEQPPAGQTVLRSDNDRGNSMTTGLTGEFTLEVPANRQFHISVTRDGFIPYGDTTFRAPDSPPLKIAAGESKTLPPIQISSGAILSGRLTDRESGEPIRGIQVSALRFQEGRAGFDRYAFPVGPSVASDADGRFSIGKLAPGEYRIALMASEKTTARSPKDDKEPRSSFGYPAVFYPGVREYSQALNIQVSAGAHLDYLDMKLEKIRLYSIRGQIGGSPDKKRLTVFTQFETGWGTTFGLLGKLDKLGAFEIVNVAPGKFNLAVTAEEGNADPKRQQLVQSFEVAEDIKDLELNLAYGSPLTVSIDPPLKQRLQVGLFPQQRIFMDTERPTDISGEEAHVFPNVFAESLRVSLRTLPTGRVLSELRYNGTPIEPEDFRLNPMHSEHKLVVHHVEVQNGIRGRVKPGYRVLAARAPLSKHDTEARAQKTTADEDGNYSFTQLNPGKWYVLQIAPDQTWASGQQLLREGKGELCEVAEKGVCALSPREP